MSIKLHVRDVLLRPILTERTTDNMQNGTYTFEVHKDANKRIIKDAIENIYEVKVEKVNVLNVKPKPKRRGQFTGKTRSWKKAMVKLQKGYTISDLENLY